MSTCEPKRYWNIIRNINKKNNSADPTPTLDSFYEHFRKLNSLDQTEEEYVPNVETSYVNIDNSALNVQITEEEIIEAINNLKNSKAVSQSDNILNEYIKGTKENFLPIYKYLFSAILDTGFLPKIWLKETTLIYKGKGTPLDPSNYRPITILSCLEKFLQLLLIKD